MSSETSISRPPAERASVPPVRIWRLSVEQYHEMIRSGILTDDDPVELLDGYLVPKMPKNPAHRAATRLLREALERILPEGWYADSQEPITLPTSEPEPDGVVVRGETRGYLDRHPGAGDVALVADVADTTLEHDRSFKKRLYAQAEIPAYWIVDLIDRRVEVFTDPSARTEGSDYGTYRVAGRDEHVALCIDGREVGRIAVRSLLP
jgi:Uma2 family endonuclease